MNNKSIPAYILRSIFYTIKSPFWRLFCFDNEKCRKIAKKCEKSGFCNVCVMVNVIYYILYSYVYLLYTFVLVSDTRGSLNNTVQSNGETSEKNVYSKKNSTGFDDHRDDIRKHSDGVICHGNSGA